MPPGKVLSVWNSPQGRERSEAGGDGAEAGPIGERGAGWWGERGVLGALQPKLPGRRHRPR